MEYRLRNPERRHPRHSGRRPIQERPRRLLRLRTHQRQIRSRTVFHVEDHLRHRPVRTSLLRRRRKDLGGELDQQIHPRNRKMTKLILLLFALLFVLLLSSRRDLLLSLSFAFSSVVFIPTSRHERQK